MLVLRDMKRSFRRAEGRSRFPRFFDPAAYFAEVGLGLGLAPSWDSTDPEMDLPSRPSHPVQLLSPSFLTLPEPFPFSFSSPPSLPPPPWNTTATLRPRRPPSPALPRPVAPPLSSTRAPSPLPLPALLRPSTRLRMNSTAFPPRTARPPSSSRSASSSRLLVSSSGPFPLRFLLSIETRSRELTLHPPSFILCCTRTQMGAGCHLGCRSDRRLPASFRYRRPYFGIWLLPPLLPPVPHRTSILSHNDAGCAKGTEET